MHAAAAPPQHALRQIIAQSEPYAGLAERLNLTRPKKMTEKLAEPIGVRLEMSKREKLERIAAARGLNVVDIMRALADELIEKQEAEYRALKAIFGHPGE